MVAKGPGQRFSAAAGVAGRNLSVERNSERADTTNGGDGVRHSDPSKHEDSDCSVRSGRRPPTRRVPNAVILMSLNIVPGCRAYHFFHYAHPLDRRNLETSVAVAGMNASILERPL